MRIIITVGSEHLLLKPDAPLDAILNALDGATPVKRTYNNKAWELSTHKDTEAETTVISDSAAAALFYEDKEASNG